MGYFRDAKESFAGRKIAKARETTAVKVKKSRKRSKARGSIDAAGDRLVTSLVGQKKRYLGDKSKRKLSEREKKALVKSSKAKVSKLVKAQEGGGLRF